jgi:hypothetical protein
MLLLGNRGPREKSYVEKNSTIQELEESFNPNNRRLGVLEFTRNTTLRKFVTYLESNLIVGCTKKDRFIDEATICFEPVEA